MKIRTVIHDNPDTFDEKVNALLEQGYMLGERTTIMTSPKLAHYAQMVLPDPVPEPKQGDPVEALRCIRDFCEATPTEKCLIECPLSRWCNTYTEDDTSPADWLLPGEEGDR